MSGNKSHKEAAVSFLKLCVDGKIREAYETYVDPNMRHHNAYFPGDAASLQKGMEDSHIQFPQKTIDIKFAVEDGNLVSTFSHVRMQPGHLGVALMHAFRFEGDRIVEMWDIGQPVPEKSPNKNGMF